MFSGRLRSVSPVSFSAASASSGVSMAAHKRRLRESNAKLASELVHITGWEHRRVNAELNRQAGIRRVTQATAEQLERRIRHAESWLRKS